MTPPASQLSWKSGQSLLSRMVSSERWSRKVFETISRGERALVASKFGINHWVTVAGMEACSKTSLMTVPFGPGRDENRRNAHAEAIEVKGIVSAGVAGLRYEAVRGAGRRGHVVVDPAVFVINDEQRGGGPKRGIFADLVIDRSDELLTGRTSWSGC
jgi:hypothetical protein